MKEIARETGPALRFQKFELGEMPDWEEEEEEEEISALMLINVNLAQLCHWMLL